MSGLGFRFGSAERDRVRSRLVTGSGAIGSGAVGSGAVGSGAVGSGAVGSGTIISRTTGLGSTGLGSMLKANLAQSALNEFPLMSHSDRRDLAGEVAVDLEGMTPIKTLLADPRITDICVNGEGPVWVEREGRVEQTAVRMSRQEVDYLIERVVTPVGVRADRLSPIADARLDDGSRVHVVLPPLAIDGPYVTIRRFRAYSFTVDDFAAGDQALLLRELVGRRRSIVVCGGTGSGKSSLLSALAAEAASEERIVTIEDSAELSIAHPHAVRLESRGAGTEGSGEVTIRDLLRASLRMRPDRIVIGEVRGAECFDMIAAMNTGHNGSMSTVHANDAWSALLRIESLAMLAGTDLPATSIRAQIATAIDEIVHVARMKDGQRRVVGIWSVRGDGNDLALEELS